MGVNPVIELVKVPVAVPSEVLVFKIVGFGLVLQQTPLAVSKSFPLDEIFPPDEAVFPPTTVVIALIDVVVNVGKDLVPVVKLISSLYAVPAELIA